MVPPALADALARARADWLAGQPDAWRRYADCVARVRAAVPAPRIDPPSGESARPPAVDARRALRFFPGVQRIGRRV